MIKRQGLRRGPRHFNLLVNGGMYYLEINVVENGVEFSLTSSTGAARSNALAIWSLGNIFAFA
jgi:hypothetical protein